MENRVKKYREEAGITQEGLAQQASVSRQSIISIEKGQYVPTTILALKISKLLKAPVEDLFVLEKKDWK
jgi:putative transcriptional regulator